MSDKIIHKFGEGKYTVIFEGGILRAERYGTPWRSLTGDGMVLAMLQQYDDLKAANQRLEDTMVELDRTSQQVIEAHTGLLSSLLDPAFGLMPDVAEKIRKHLERAS